jgi:hypothetical protein
MIRCCCTSSRSGPCATSTVSKAAFDDA